MLRNVKKLSLIVAILLIVQILPAIGLQENNTIHTYEGVENANIHLRNIQFNDIRNHWGREAILEAAALSLMRGNSNRFQPNAPLTHLEALTVLVRAIGLEEEAQQFGESQAPVNVRNQIILTAVDNWGRGYVQMALENDILTQQEANEITNLTPQQAQALEASVQQQLAAFGEDITPQERGAIERQIRDRLQLNLWNRQISRQQMAAWVARALQLEPIYGDRITHVYTFNDWNRMDTDKIPLIEAVLQKDIMRGSTQSFNPNSTLTRVEMAQIMMNIRDMIIERRGITKHIGRVVNIQEVNHRGSNRGQVTVAHPNNTFSLIQTDPHKDFILLKDNQLQTSSGLVIGDEIEFFTNDRQQVIYARGIPSPERTLEGFISSIDRNNNTLQIIDFDDRIHSFTVDSNTAITVNGRTHSFRDLQIGLEVLISYNQNRVTSLVGLLEEDPNLHGYIPPGTRTKVGDVLFINRNEVAIRTREGIERYQITSSTQIMRNDRVANINAIQKGDRLLLSFDDIYTPEISTIRVEDDERHITAVYRGEIEQVNQRSHELIINNVEVLQDQRWVKHQQQKVKLRLQDNIFMGGTEIDIRQLANQRGKTVYVAVENSFAVERAAKILVKEGGTQTVESKISSLQYGTSRMVVNNNTINFHQGTIVVMNNRLVDILNLEEQQSIFLTSDFVNNQRNAALVSIKYDGILRDRLDGSRIVIYRGRINSVGDYRLTIGRLTHQLDYLQLIDNRWVEITRPRTFSMTNETFIYDSQLEKSIDPIHFLDTRFIDANMIQDPVLRSRVRNNYYIGKTAYFVVREYGDGEAQELLAINLTPHHLFTTNRVNTDHGGKGRIVSIDLEEEKITIGELMHWNQLSGRWQSTRGEETIELRKAVILLNDAPISRQEIYQIRENANVYMIKNKDVSTRDEVYILIVEQ